MAEDGININLSVNNPDAPTDAMNRLIDALNRTTTALEKTTGGTRQLSQGMNSLGGATMQARMGFMEIESLAGIRAPRAINTFLSRLEGIGPAMAAAFSAIAVIGLIDILVTQVPAAFEKLIAVLSGWTDAAKKAYEEQIQLNKKYIQALHDQEVAQIKLQEVGKQGIGLKEQEAKDIDKIIELTGKEGVTAQQTAVKIQTAITELRKNNGIPELGQSLIPYIDLTGLADVATGHLSVGLSKLGFNTTGARGDIERLTKSLEDYQKQAAEKGADATKLRKEEKPKADREVAAQAQADARAVEAAKIDSAKRIADAQTRLDEAAAKEQFELHYTTEEQFTAALIAIEKTRAQNEQTELEKRRALAVKEQQQTGKSMKAEIDKIDAEIIAAKLGHEQKLNEINAQSAQRQVARWKELEASQERIDEERFNTAMAEQERQRNEAREEATETLRMAEEAADRKLAIQNRQDNAMLAAHRIGIKDYVADEHKAVQEWYEARQKALDAALEAAKKNYKQDSIEYRRLQDEKAKLDQERLQKLDVINDRIIKNENKALDTITKDFTSAFVKWGSGQEKLSKAIIQAWDQMAGSIIQSIAKYTVELIAASLTQQQVDEKSILGAAKSAAARQYEKAIASLPLPAPFNMIVAGLEAAAVFAAVAAFKSFGAGGIMDEDNFAQLHKEEMVLPASLSNFIQRAAATASAAPGFSATEASAGLFGTPNVATASGLLAARGGAQGGAIGSFTSPGGFPDLGRSEALRNRSNAALQHFVHSVVSTVNAGQPGSGGAGANSTALHLNQDLHFHGDVTKENSMLAAKQMKQSLNRMIRTGALKMPK